jgi:hypothetical protein
MVSLNDYDGRCLGLSKNGFDNLYNFSINVFHLVGVTKNKVLIIPRPGELAVVEEGIGYDAPIGRKNKRYVRNKQMYKGEGGIRILGNRRELLKDKILAIHIKTIGEIDFLKL